MSRGNENIAWINCAKFIAILAVLTDHAGGVAEFTQDIMQLSYFSVTLFILLSGMTSYLSITRHGYGWFKTFIKMSQTITVAYCFAVFIYQVYLYRYFDISIYGKYLFHFDISGPHYFVLLYLQLAIISKALWHLASFCHGKYEMLWEILSLVPIVFIAYLTTNFSNIFDVYGGGGKLLGGTYLIVFYWGMLLAKHYDAWGRCNITKSIMISVLSIALAYIWWRFECRDCFHIDSLIPFGAGFNPPSITSITMAIIMLFVSYGIFTIFEQCRYTKYMTAFVSWLGKYTLYIFLYHKLFLGWILARIEFQNIQNIQIKRLTCFVFMIAGPIFMAEIIKLVKSFCRIAIDCNDSLSAARRNEPT